MLDQFARRMHHHFGGLWVSQQAQSEEDLRVNLMLWAKQFRSRGMTLADVDQVLTHATTENMPFPTPGHFFKVWDTLQETARGQASYRPASEVLTRHTGAKAHRLPPETQARKAQRKQVGREHMAKMRDLLA